MHTINVSYSRTRSASLKQYAFVEDVAGNAGINGVATDFRSTGGVPQLSFSSMTGVRDVTRQADGQAAVAVLRLDPSP